MSGERWTRKRRKGRSKVHRCITAKPGPGTGFSLLGKVGAIEKILMVPLSITYGRSAVQLGLS